MWWSALADLKKNGAQQLNKIEKFALLFFPGQLKQTTKW